MTFHNTETKKYVALSSLVLIWHCPHQEAIWY